MDKRIVYTRHDGGVSICRPSVNAISWMSRGGFYEPYPRGFMDVQIERQIADGISADAARRFCHAMAFGGLTTAEALEVIRDRDCAPHGTAIELWDVEEVPTDRWFRNAWSRSHNGGPININLGLAKPLQLKHIKNAVRWENERRDSLLLEPVEIDFPKLRERIRNARDEEELRTIWPDTFCHSS